MREGGSAGTVSVFSGQTDEQVGRQTYRRARDGGHFLHKAKCPVLQARQTEFCHLGTGPPGALSDITKGALNTRVPAHYHASLSRLQLGLLSSKQCFRLLLFQDKHSALAELP